MKYQNALASLKFKKANKFALIGNEPYLKEKFILSTIKVYQDNEVESFLPEDQEEALSRLASCSLFDDSIVILSNFDKMKVSAFEKYIDSYTGCLILKMSEKANLKSREMTNILSKMTLVECPKLREYGTDYPYWIHSYISNRGYKTTNEVSQFIFSRIGPNMFSIDHELEKLFMVKGEEKDITLEDIRNYVSITSTSTAFEIFENLMKNDVPSALASFYSYTKNKDTFIDIVAFLSVYFEKMYRVNLLKEEKFESDDIADILGIPRFILKTKYLSKALAMGKTRIGEKLNNLCHIDVQLRTFKGNNKILLEKFILDFSNNTQK